MKDVGESGWLRPGARLIGKYEIVRPIGRGGFGLVYEARHLGLRARVAIKVLLREGRQHPQTLERFRREAWACAQIKSPHVVRVTDVDVLEDGTPFIVMELLQGRDLEAELGLRRLALREAVGYVLQAASALSEAHARGVVHRDLKPNNLFLAEQGGSRILKVLDFGLSKIASELSVTKTSAQLGTPLYMSPEQLRSSKGVDGRSDIWSLGVILYRMLALRPPFDAATAADVMVAIMSQPAPELSRLAPDVPSELASIVMKTLRKNPLERYQSVAELAHALLPFGPPGVFVNHAAAVSAPLLGPSATLTDSSQDTPIGSTSSRGRAHALLVPALVALGIVLAGVGLRAWWVAAATHAEAAASASLPAAPLAATLPATSSSALAVVSAVPAALPRAVASTSAEPAAEPRPPSKRRTQPSPALTPAPKQDLGF